MICMMVAIVLQHTLHVETCCFICGYLLVTQKKRNVDLRTELLC